MRQKTERRLIAQPPWTNLSACGLGDRTDTRADHNCHWSMNLECRGARRHSAAQRGRACEMRHPTHEAFETSSSVHPGGPGISCLSRLVLVVQ
jgi:hypothetical protein